MLFNHITKPIAMNHVSIEDSFWRDYVTLVKEVVIPYQWGVLNDSNPLTTPSYAMENLKIAAGIQEGAYRGIVFLDSDLAKWLEAVGYVLQKNSDPALEEQADYLIDLLEKAQLEDGYLNTYHIINGIEKRWTNLLECHELYCAGHLLEGAIAYYQGTGKKKILEIMTKYIEHIKSVFGPMPHQKKGYPGHQEIELALMKFYQLTKDESALELAKYFLDERGKLPYYYDEEWEKRDKISYWNNQVSNQPSESKEYCQAHLEVRKQDKAVGHAVRAVYMYTAMADLARERKDHDLYQACQNLWENMTGKQMYINGSIGSTVHGEAFTYDYDLPNDTIYAETCAAIGLIFFGKRMLLLEPNSNYADTMENALYNTVLASMAKDGKHFFYVNPLEVYPTSCHLDVNKKHVKAERQGWFGCACCPPNVARLISSIGDYIYTQDDTTCYVHLYIGNDLLFDIGGNPINLKLQTKYPYDGQVTIELGLESNLVEFQMALRIPAWCEHYTLMVNGESVVSEIHQGYAYIKRQWSDKDSIVLTMDMTPSFIRSHPRVRTNNQKLALMRGPLLYCIEEVDNGANLAGLQITSNSILEQEETIVNLGKLIALSFEGIRQDDSEDLPLYQKDVENSQITVQKIKAIPYYLWGNRGAGEMLVWLGKGY